MKNDQLHNLTASQLKTLQNARGEHSCLDNTATTQEMRFLAKVWQKTGIEKYKESDCVPVLLYDPVKRAVAAGHNTGPCKVEAVIGTISPSTTT